VAVRYLGRPIEEDLLVVLDSWEHAFMLDYGINRPDYINAFLENFGWTWDLLTLKERYSILTGPFFGIN
jgi:superoxide dismutase